MPESKGKNSVNFCYTNTFSVLVTLLYTSLWATYCKHWGILFSASHAHELLRKVQWILMEVRYNQIISKVVSVYNAHWQPILLWVEGTRVLNSYTLDVSMLTVVHFRSSTKVLWGEYWKVLWGISLVKLLVCLHNTHTN